MGSDKGRKYKLRRWVLVTSQWFQSIPGPIMQHAPLSEATREAHAADAVGCTAVLIVCCQQGLWALCSDAANSRWQAVAATLPLCSRLAPGSLWHLLRGHLAASPPGDSKGPI